MKNTEETSELPGAVFDQLQRRTNGAGSGVNRAGYQTVDFCPVPAIRVPRTTLSSSCSRATASSCLVLTQFDQATHIAFAEPLPDRRFQCRRQAQRPWAEATRLISSGLPSRTQVAILRSAQIAAASTVRGSSPSGRTTRFADFARQPGQLVAEGWRRETAAALGGRGQRSDPVGVDVVGHVFLNFSIRS